MALQWYKYEGLLKNLKYCTIWFYFTLLVKWYKHFNVLKTQGTEIRVAVRIFLLYAMVLNIQVRCHIKIRPNYLARKIL